MIRSRTLLPFALLALASLGAAQNLTYRVDGAVTETVLIDSTGSPIADEFTTGTPIELTFSYDPDAAVAAQIDAFEAIYDAPFAVRGRIGNRAFSANASFVQVIDDVAELAGGATGDALQFRVDPIFAEDFDTVTDATITEANPFETTNERLTYFFVQFGRVGGAAFSGTDLPGSLDLSRFDSNRFFFDYYNQTGGTTTDVFGSVASVTPVPEPATMAALGLGALALLRRRRSR